MMVKRYEAQFDISLDRENAGPVTRTLIIASTPRSGSHMLGHSMTETGAMGVPFEYANPFNLPLWETRLGVQGMEQTLEALMGLRTTQNGVFSIKLHYTHMQQLGGIDAMLQMFPNPSIVHIYRADILKQAISLSRAMQTGVWIDGMEGNGTKPAYNYSQIKGALQEVAVHNALWRADLAAAGQAFLDVEFETVRADVPGTLRRIATFAGIDLSEDRVPAAPPTKAQSTAGNALETVRRYAADSESSGPNRSVLGRLKHTIRKTMA